VDLEEKWVNNMANEIKEDSTQTTSISGLVSSLDGAMATNVPTYQYSKSYEIKSNISTLLHILNQESYSYVLNINDYIRNNIKDSSFLKKSLIEKIQGNMGG